MKKILVLFALLTISLASCGKNEDPNPVIDPTPVVDPTPTIEEKFPLIDVYDSKYEEYEVYESWQDCRERFFDAMYDRAAALGCTFERIAINSPIGISNRKIKLHDMFNITVAALNNDTVKEFLDDEEATLNVEGPRSRTDRYDSIIYRASDSHYLTDYYEVIGAKSGYVAKNESRGYCYTMGMSVKAPNDGQFICYYSLEKDTMDNGENNTFSRLKQIFDIASAKYNDPKTDTFELEANLNVDAYGVIYLPKDINLDDYIGYDWLNDYSDFLLAKKNIEHPIVTASTWKMLTTLTASQYIKDFNTKLTVVDEDINATKNELYPNDIVTFTDLYNLVYQISSNTANNVIASNLGRQLLKVDEYNYAHRNDK